MSPIPWARIVGVLALVAAAFGMLIFGVTRIKADGASACEAKDNAKQAEREQAVNAAQERARTSERQLSQARQEIVDAQNTAKLQVAATAAAFRADADRVRGQLSAALGGRDRADDSLESCQRRAATAGDLLADGLLVQTELAKGAESHAADLRAVRAYDAQVKAAQGPGAGGSAP
jgi:hypothetical protein